MSAKIYRMWFFVQPLLRVLRGWKEFPLSVVSVGLDLYFAGVVIEGRGIAKNSAKLKEDLQVNVAPDRCMQSQRLDERAKKSVIGGID